MLCGWIRRWTLNNLWIVSQKRLMGFKRAWASLDWESMATSSHCPKAFPYQPLSWITIEFGAIWFLNICSESCLPFPCRWARLGNGLSRRRQRQSAWGLLTDLFSWSCFSLLPGHEYRFHRRLFSLKERCFLEFLPNAEAFSSKGWLFESTPSLDGQSDVSERHRTIKTASFSIVRASASRKKESYQNGRQRSCDNPCNTISDVHALFHVSWCLHNHNADSKEKKWQKDSPVKRRDAREHNSPFPNVRRSPRGKVLYRLLVIYEHLRYSRTIISQLASNRFISNTFVYPSHKNISLLSKEIFL